MSLPQLQLALSPSFKPSMVKSFSLPPGLSKDEKKKFESLQDNIMTALDPQDFIEATYVDQLSHLLWQIQQIRNRIESLTINAREEGIIAVLNGRCENLAELVAAYRRRDPEAINTIGKKLQEFVLTQFDIDTHARQAVGRELINLEQALEAKRDQFERFVQSYEKRRFIVAERLRRLAEIQPKESGGNTDEDTVPEA
jgi:hypothetical protein